MKPWDRLPEETDAAFAAFEVFLHLPKVSVKSPEFSSIVKEKTGLEIPEESLATYQTKNKWRDRRRAYQSWILNRRMEKVADTLAKDAVKSALNQAKTRRLAQQKAMKSLSLIDIIAGADVKEHVAFLTAIRQAIEIAGFTAVDNDNQSHRIRKAVGQSGGIDFESDEIDELSEVPEDAYAVQPGSPEASGVLGQADSDMSGRGESSDSDGPGSVG